MPKKYYRFRDFNYYLNRTKDYYIPLTPKEHERLTNEIFTSKSYTLLPLEQWTGETELDQLISGHKNSTSEAEEIIKCLPMRKIPRVENFDIDDPYYEGNAFDWIGKKKNKFNEGEKL